MADLLQERAERVENAYRLLQGNKDNLGNIPGILRQLVTLKVWEGYLWKGKTVEFSSFREFVETPPPTGLGTTVADLILFCKKYPEIADKIDLIVQEQTPSYHPPSSVYNVHTPKRPSGNSFQRSIRRLRNLSEENSKAAELRKKVLRGEMSPNQALRELGVRAIRIGITPTKESVVNFIKKYLSRKEITEVIELLQK